MRRAPVGHTDRPIQGKGAKQSREVIPLMNGKSLHSRSVSKHIVLLILFAKTNEKRPFLLIQGRYPVTIGAGLHELLAPIVLFLKHPAIWQSRLGGSLLLANRASLGE